MKYGESITQANEVDRLINHAFKMGQSYQKDCENEMSGNYSDYYAPSLDGIKKKILALFNVVGQSEQYCDWCKSTEKVDVTICKECRQGMDDHR